MGEGHYRHIPQLIKNWGEGSKSEEGNQMQVAFKEIIFMRKLIGKILGNIARAVGDFVFLNWNGQNITVNSESNGSTCVKSLPARGIRYLSSRFMNYPQRFHLSCFCALQPFYSMDRQGLVVSPVESMPILPFLY